MTLTRRQFVGRTVRAGMAASAAGLIHAVPVQAEPKESPAKPAGFPLVDTHQHLWDLDKLAPPWVKGAGPLNRSYVMKDYREAIAGLNITKAVYMEVDVRPEDEAAEAEHVIEICKRGDAPTCAAVIGGRPGEPGFREYITRFKGSPYIKGVRQILPGPQDGKAFYLEKPFLDGIRLLGELGMSFDLCMPSDALASGAKLVDQCPETRFILDHCGNADPNWSRAARQNSAETAASRRSFDQWRRDIAGLGQRKNLVCKISGIIARVPKDWTPDDLAPIIDHCLDSFGPDRVMFASDWPVCTRGATLRQWVEALRAVVARRPEADQRKLLGENAVRFYGLK